MTSPLPPEATEPFTTLPELAVWAQEAGDPPAIPEDRVPFAEAVLAAVAVVIRHYGSVWWTRVQPVPDGMVLIPPRAKLMADLKAKNFYEHPTGAISETTGPISERFIEEVVQQLEFSQAEQSLLAELAGEDSIVDGPVEVDGLWALSTTRGPLETHTLQAGVITVPYWRPSSQSIPFFAEGAFGSPEP